MYAKPVGRAIALTVLALLCFAGNSLLCRLALRDAQIDVYSFTSLRIVSGAGVLWILATLRPATLPGRGTWISAIALFSYAAGFSFAYTRLTTATGALLLFSAVQTTMISHGISKGERLGRWQVLGLGIALAGLVVLLMPGLETPSPVGACSMLGAGAAWGLYSLRGRGAGDPTKVTAGNFVRASPMAIAMSIVMAGQFEIGGVGFLCALASGALTSGVGYAVWYTALPMLNATTAATVQLSVPVIASLGGILFLKEPISILFVGASIAILGGIALSIAGKT